MESSGTIVNSIAIESAVAFVEKRDNHLERKRILAVDGTWAGGYGTAREGTGFGVATCQLERGGIPLWVDRCLPAPIEEQKQAFLSLLKQKLHSQEVAGIYLEPDVIGDLGLVTVDHYLLQHVKTLMHEHNLPIILDCVQQLGRSGSYWGEHVDTLFADYPLLIVTTAKAASNGQPFGYTIMPKEIADAAYPLSQITTNQMNGPLLRSLVVAAILEHEELQAWLRYKAQQIEEVAANYNYPQGYFGLRGKYLNRGVYLEDDEQVKLAQLALLVEDGILVGATPHSIRYQPMLLEYSATNRLVAEAIFRRVQMIQAGHVSPLVRHLFENMHTVTGLARNKMIPSPTEPLAGQ